MGETAISYEWSNVLYLVKQASGPLLYGLDCYIIWPTCKYPFTLFSVTDSFFIFRQKCFVGIVGLWMNENPIGRYQHIVEARFMDTDEQLIREHSP